MSESKDLRGKEGGSVSGTAGDYSNGYIAETVARLREGVDRLEKTPGLLGSFPDWLEAVARDVRDRCGLTPMFETPTQAEVRRAATRLYDSVVNNGPHVAADAEVLRRALGGGSRG